jgi:thiamine-phosphate pyrophosphorylase
MNFSLPCITPERTVARETDVVNELFINNLKRLHLRKPSFSLSDYRSYIRSIYHAFHSRIAIHGCLELIEEFPSLGYHVKSDDRKDTDFMDKVKNTRPSTLSTSFHSWQEIEENEIDYNYVFISPVFNSISKQGYSAAIDITKVSEVKNKLSAQNKKAPAIIALGGVDTTKISLLRSCGFDGAAVLGAVWETPDPIKAFKEIQETIKKLSTD